MATTIIAMAIPTLSPRAPHSILARIATCTLAWLVAFAAIGWGAYALPRFWQQGPLDHVTSEDLEGQGFAGDTLFQVARDAEAAKQFPFCNPTRLHNLLIIRLAILNGARAVGDQPSVKLDYVPLYLATRAVLSCAPSDSFAWLVLFWLDVSRHGFTSNNAPYLRLSYDLSPNEEWIALWRNSLALSIFSQLPPDLANDAVDEFIKLVNTEELYSQTVQIFAGLAPEAQNRIVGKIDAVKAEPRQIFARMLYDEGIDVAIPGFHKPQRPWQ
jgi:hypothetical protein